jgi:6-phosphogluconolactonase
VLSGGATPRPVYESLGVLLASSSVDPQALYFFLGDERVAERGSPDRNETMVQETLFRAFAPRPENVFYWDASPLPVAESAAHYAAAIEGFLTSRGRAPDLALLGLGADGHTASLFPGAEALVEGIPRPLDADTPGDALAVHVPAKDLWRLSLSARFLRSCGETVFLVGGEGKDEAILRLARRDPGLPATWAASGEASIFKVR